MLTADAGRRLQTAQSTMRNRACVSVCTIPPRRLSRCRQRDVCLNYHLSRHALSFVVLLLFNSLCILEAFLPRCTNVQVRHHVSSSSSWTTSTTLSAKSKKKKKPKDTTIAVNRQAYRNFEIIDTLEVGIALKGTEVKSIRDGKLTLRDGYVKPDKNGRSCVLHNVHIGKHTMAAEYFNHEERRPRDLLIHKEEARKLMQQTEQQGMTIVPLKAYFNDFNLVKFQIALCRGKNVRDKRVAIKERDAKREESRIIKSFRSV
jgi:SsrA-binding protein